MLMDQNGNSPLHYAAKYGHLELCKYLIERGSLVNMKNKQQQSPYDVSQSHSVRQFLLPLQFQAERDVSNDSYAQLPSQTVYSDSSSYAQTPVTSPSIPTANYHLNGQISNGLSYGSAQPPPAFGVTASYGAASTHNRSTNARFQPGLCFINLF